MSGRAATTNIIPGNYALAVGPAPMPAPHGWRWVCLADVAQLESGHTPSRLHPEYWDGGIPWIGIKDAREHHGKVISETLQTVTQAGIDNSAARLLPPATVCLSRTASVGYVTVMGQAMATSQDFVNWICGPELDPHFLKQLLIAENESLFRFGKGSTHTTIYYPEVKAFHVCLPPIGEQRRIVAKLEALQSRSRRAREALDAIPSLLEKLRQSILGAAFRGDLTADWRAQNPNTEPATALLARIRTERRKNWEEAEFAKLKAMGKTPTDDKWKAKYQEPRRADDADLPVLANGWCWASVDELSDLQLGQQRAPMHTEAATTFPYVRVANIKWDGLDLSDIKQMGFPDPDRYRLRRGDVLLTEASGSPTEVGKPAIWREEIPNCCYQKTLLRARPVSPAAGPEWLHLSFLADALLGRFARMAPGVGILHLTAERMRPWPVPLAPLEEQERLIERTTAALMRVKAVEQQAAELRTGVEQVAQSLLARAFSGRLVPQDANDEPDNVTLKRAPTTVTKRQSARRARAAE